MITVASNLTVNVHVSEDTRITHRVHNSNAPAGCFAAVEVGDAALLLDLDDLDRLTAALRVARDDLANAVSKVAA